MNIKILEGGKLPKKSHLPDVGLDIFMPTAFKIRPFETLTIGLKLIVAIPDGYAGMIVPRSSIAEKGLIIQTAVIDPDYTGEIHLIITNCSAETYIVNEGDRVCSLVVYSVLNSTLKIVEDFPKTNRGMQGLGSTGL